MTTPTDPSNVSTLTPKPRLVGPGRSLLIQHRFTVHAVTADGPGIAVASIDFDRRNRRVRLTQAYGRETSPHGLTIVATLRDRIERATRDLRRLLVVMHQKDGERVAQIVVDFVRTESDHGPLSHESEEPFREVVILHDASIGDLEWLVPSAEPPAVLKLDGE